MLPPTQGLDIQLQSLGACSLITVSLPVLMAYRDSAAAVVAYAQQLPHPCWSFTGATTPGFVWECVGLSMVRGVSQEDTVL